MNDSFGDVSVMTVAMVADDGFSENEKNIFAQDIRGSLYRVDDTQKVSFLGVRRLTDE